MKERFITITEFNRYHGLMPFEVGKTIQCVKDTENAYDAEAIKATLQPIGTVGYVANTPYMAATGTMTARGIYDEIGKKFWAKVMFITNSKVICKVLDGKTRSKSI